MKEVYMKMGTVPFREGLFLMEDERAFLLGNKCATCGQIYFPSRPFCFECFGEAMNPIRLGAQGTLYSYTVSYMPSAHFTPPYTAGWIDVVEGIRVFAPIRVKEGQTLDIGMKMELVIDELWQEGERSVVGYLYRPG